jgi:hypothetical protein
MERFVELYHVDNAFESSGNTMYSLEGSELEKVDKMELFVKLQNSGDTDLMLAPRAGLIHQINIAFKEYVAFQLYPETLYVNDPDVDKSKLIDIPAGRTIDVSIPIVCSTLKDFNPKKFPIKLQIWWSNNCLATSHNKFKLTLELVHSEIRMIGSTSRKPQGGYISTSFDDRLITCLGDKVDWTTLHQFAGHHKNLFIYPRKRIAQGEERFSQVHKVGLFDHTLIKSNGLRETDYNVVDEDNSGIEYKFHVTFNPSKKILNNWKYKFTRISEDEPIDLVILTTQEACIDNGDFNKL